MKKLLFVLTALLILSCSSSDETADTSISDFNPPTWIQGTWKQLDNGTDYGQGFKFTKNDFCRLTQNVEICEQGTIDNLRKAGAKPTVEETISTTSYIIKISYDSGTSVTHTFRKTSETILNYGDGAGTELTKK